MPRTSLLVAPLALGLFASVSDAAPIFVNGLVLDATTLDAAGGTSVNDGRLGFFSDIYYDPKQGDWYALSDRGPGGGTLDYEVRVHRFTLDVDRVTGAISNFQVQRTFIFRKGAQAFNGFAPEVGGPLGNAFDPEGFVLHPITTKFIVSDEYGPSVYEFARSGQFLRAYETPANLLPRNPSTGVVNFASDVGNSAGKRTNRGFEGLAISPDGQFVYAMLQSAMLDEGGADGVFNRIVKYSASTGRPVGQYAYRMEGASQGRGISALVAINQHELLVLERNNRGIGVEADLASPNKKVYRIDLRGATDISNVDLDSSGAAFTAVTKASIAPWLDLALPTTLSAPSLSALNGVSPEKWEGLTIGPKLADGSYLVLAGTDNDYSVTQNADGVQFDRYFAPGAFGTVNRIQCDIGTFTHCSFVNANGSLGAVVPVGFDTSGYRLIPGVLHAYKASANDLRGLVRPGPGASGQKD